MSVVRRGAVGAVVAGVVLLGGSAWAQEDPCAPGPDGEPRPEPGAEAPTSDGPGAVGDEGVVCAFGVPVLADGEDAVLESAAGGGSVSAGSQLPRTGPYDRLLALTAVGAGLVLLGAGAAAGGRRSA
jgi:hypothetical protein